MLNCHVRCKKGQWTYHIWSVICLPSSSIVLILKSVAGEMKEGESDRGREGGREGVIEGVREGRGRREGGREGEGGEGGSLSEVYVISLSLVVLYKHTI